MTDTKEVLNREVKRLRRFAYSLTSNAADADDLVHDLVIKVLKQGLPDYDDPVPWLITICKNLWFDKLRNLQVRQRAAENEIIEESKLMQADNTIAHIQLSQVVTSLQLLPKDQRLALSLVGIEGMSYAEAAKQLDVPIGTVMSRVCRARAFLIDHLGNNTGATS